MAKLSMETFRRVGYAVAVTAVGLAWAGGAYSSAPLLSLVPAVVHTILGWVTAAAGGIGIFQSFSK